MEHLWRVLPNRGRDPLGHVWGKRGGATVAGWRLRELERLISVENSRKQPNGDVVESVSCSRSRRRKRGKKKNLAVLVTFFSIIAVHPATVCRYIRPAVISSQPINVKLFKDGCSPHAAAPALQYTACLITSQITLPHELVYTALMTRTKPRDH